MKKTNFFLTALCCIAFGISAMAQTYLVGDNGTLMRSTNQGKTWKNQRTGIQFNLEAVYSKKDTVYFSGENSRIFKSFNGGLKDTLIYGAGANNHDWSEIGFFNSKTGMFQARAYRGTATSDAYTTDGGKTWLQKGVGGNVYGLQVIDSAFAWMINRNIVQKTTDIGNTWNNVYRPVNFNSIASYQDSIAVVVGDAGTAYATKNKGANWTKLNLGTTKNLSIVNVSPDGKVWLIGGPNGYLVRSTDTAKTWVPVNATTLTINYIAFSDTNTVSMVTNNNQNGHSVFFSTNAGQSFSAIPNDSLRNSTGRVGQLLTVTFLNKNFGLMSGAGDGTRLYKTTNGGAKWINLPLDTSGVDLNRNMACHIIFSPDTFVVGYNGAYGASGVFRTVNGGRSFTQINMRGSNDQRASAIRIDNRTGYIVGQNGFIFKTTDQGQTWVQSVIDPNGSSLNSINGYWVAGNNGKVYRTNNNYGSFVESNPLGYKLGSLRDLYAFGKDSLYVVGLGGTILKSVDKGLNWKFSGDLSLANNFLSLWFPKPSTGIVVGENGFVIRTTDYGTTWNKQYLGTTNLNYVQFMNDSVGFIAGDAGAAFRTTNAGATWQAVYTGTKENLAKAWFADSLNVTDTLANIGLRADTVRGYQNTVATIPVRVKDFKTLLGLKSVIRWDTAVANLNGFVSAGNLPGLKADSSLKKLGILGFSWLQTSKSQNVTLPDSTIIFSLKLRVKGQVGGFSNIWFGGAGSAEGAADSSALTRFVTYVAGKLTIGPKPRITTGATSASVYCLGAKTKLPFTIAGGNYVSPNTFTAQLSDSAGSFANATSIGTLVSNTPDSISITFPTTAKPSALYRLRILASNPTDTGSISATAITLSAIPAKPVVTPTGSLNICPGDSVILTAPAGFALYQWSNNASTQSITVKTAGTFTVKVINAAGCTSPVSTNTVTTAPSRPAAPAVTLTGGTNTLCGGDSVTLTASNANAYLWSTGATTRSIVVKTAGTYTVQVKPSATGCLSLPSAATTITVNTPPAVATVTQVGDSLLANGTGTKYLWYLNNTLVTGAANSLAHINIRNKPGSYTVKVVANGCTSAASAPVVVAGIGNNLANINLRAYPVPTSDKLVVEMSASDRVARLQLTDLAGRTIQEIALPANSEKTELELGSLPSGAYLLQAITADGLRKVVRVSKQ